MNNIKIEISVEEYNLIVQALDLAARQLGLRAYPVIALASKLETSVKDQNVETKTDKE